MTEAHIGAIAGFATAVLSIMIGILIRSINKLNDKFDASSSDCRKRHENIVHKDEYTRDYYVIDSKVNSIDNRVNRIESKMEE
jgi:hypothetical protein